MLRSALAEGSLVSLRQNLEDIVDSDGYLQQRCFVRALMRWTGLAACEQQITESQGVPAMLLWAWRGFVVCVGMTNLEW